MGTMDIIYAANEINLINILTYDFFMKYYKTMNITSAQFLQTLTKVGLSKIENLRFLLKNFQFYREIAKLNSFLEAFSLFYSVILLTMLLAENDFDEKAINNSEKVKRSISVLYYENYLISSKLLEAEEELGALETRKLDPLFVSFVSQFYQKFVRSKDLMKKYSKKRHKAL
jgi:hypothetical protein